MPNKDSTAATWHYGVLLSAVLPGAMITSVETTFLVTTARLDPAIVGTFNYATSFLGILVVYYVGNRRIDRWDPVTLSISCLVLTVLSALLAFFAGVNTILLLPAALLGAIAAIGSSSIFTYDEKFGPAAEASGGLFRTRLVFSLAWIVGPPAAFFIFWMWGMWAVIVAMGALASFSSLLMLNARGRPQNSKPQVTHDKDREGTSGITLGFLPIFVIMVAVTCANVLHSINLPLYLIETLGVPSFWPGLMMATAATVEVIVIALLPRLTRVWRDDVLLWSGLSLGIVYFAMLVYAGDPAFILALQVIYGAHFALTTVVCLPLLRKALAGGTGSLAAQFNNAGRIGGLLGSIAFAGLAGALGFRGILVIMCQFLLLAGLAFTLTSVWRATLKRS